MLVHVVNGVSGSVILSDEPAKLLYSQILTCRDVATVGGYPFIFLDRMVIQC